MPEPPSDWNKANQLVLPKIRKHEHTVVFEWLDGYSAQIIFSAENTFGMRIHHYANADMTQDCVFL